MRRARPATGLRRIRKSIVWLGSLAGLVLLLATASSLARAADASRPKLLLLPIVVHSAESPDYVRDGLADMLSARFSRIGAVELIKVEDPERSTTRLDEAVAVARRSGADFVLFGSFTRFGKGASLDVQCAPVAPGHGSEPLREIFVHSGSIGEIIPDLDELAGKVSRFARGEAVVVSSDPIQPGPAAAATGAAPDVATSPDFLDLLERVESLESMVSDLLEGQGSSELDDELR
ncbi:MAG: hypothetical protein JRG86_05205 [Deltaproteobacteria bacterium]|jgi:TolB-like protein|nr:hypothetical protein [Deltaproteobacteria bacterium]MBW2500051.1 hypothetical protein [Deltaproteobacteria bacterium]